MYRSFHHNQYFARCMPLTAHFTSACDDGRRCIFTLTAQICCWPGPVLIGQQRRWCFKGFVPRPVIGHLHHCNQWLRPMQRRTQPFIARFRATLIFSSEHLHANLLAISWRIFCVTAPCILPECPPQHRHYTKAFESGHSNCLRQTALDNPSDAIFGDQTPKPVYDPYVLQQ